MKRFKQNLSNYKLATMEMGRLVPVQVQEVLPGDSFRMETSALVRVTPMLAPIMHPVTVRFHHWFVPNRILWDGWEDFITGGPDNQNADVVPTVTVPSDAENSVLDYMGIPPVEDLEVNALPIKAYNKIYNEFYRDQDLIDERGEDDTTIAPIAWGKDYFTTARPWSQKGDALQLPIGNIAPVTLETLPDSYVETRDVAAVSSIAGGYESDGTISGNGHRLVADLSSATGIDAIQFREFFALQRYAEARANYGSRYSEYLRYLGVTPSDARLQRPEYLGGGKQNLQFSEVLQTVDDDTGTERGPLGKMGGHGISALRTKPTRKFFEEHGHVITLMSVLPRSIYQDGVQRNWLRQDKEDYFQKELQSVGMQVIKQAEVYADPDTAHDTFGYSDRYSEYTNTPSTVSGEFRDLLDYWHMARKFETPPALNETFINCEPTKRIYAEQNQHPLWCMINNKVHARRPVRKTTVGRLM